jgi:GAF domain-containing protein
VTVEPIPESLEALTMLSMAAEGPLVPQLQQAADKVVALVPECVGMSVSHFDDDLTFTLLATSDRLRMLDAAQYLDGGPCEVAAIDGADIDVDVDDVLDEDRWQLFALASAAQGVRSSLSLPLRRRSSILGSVNLYARTPYAFIGREGDLARLFGARMSDAVANADLSMASVGRARVAVKTLEDHDTIVEAVNRLAAIERVTPAEAEDRLYDAANRAGVDTLSLARLLLETRH